MWTVSSSILIKSMAYVTVMGFAEIFVKNM
jgi:hypothetical protein